MFEGLIEFIETTVFGLINEISARETSGLRQVRSIIAMLLEFAQTNKGMTRVLIGDALVNENERLQERINQLIERIEASLKQSFRVAATEGELADGFDSSARAALVVAFVVGRWHRFAKSGFRKVPAEAPRSAVAGPGRLGFRGRQWPSLAGQHQALPVSASPCASIICAVTGSHSSSVHLSLSADRTLRVTRHAHRVPLHRERIEHQQPADQCGARVGGELQRLGCLHRADDPGQRRKHAHDRAQFVLAVARRKEARVAGRVVAPDVERSQSARRSGWRHRRRAAGGA